MAVWFHTMVLTTSIAATVAVGIASAAIYTGDENHIGAKSDRLPVMAAATNYVTIETRSDGVSVLSRIPTVSN